MCHADGCINQAQGHGLLCPTHYRQQWALSNPPCSEVDCTTNAWAKGLCKRHYDRQWRATRAFQCRVGGCTTYTVQRGGLCPAHKPKHRKERAYTLRLRIIDLLDIDDGWWTVHGIADRLGASVDGTNRHLRRLRDEGVIVSKFDDHTERVEWRIA